MVKEVSDKEIREKYVKPPTIEQMLSFINDLDVKYSHFEYYFRLHKGVIKNVKGGFKPLPVKYWPLFYERIVPQYGISYKSINEFIFRQDKKAKKNVPKTVSIPVSDHDNSHPSLSNY